MPQYGNLKIDSFLYNDSGSDVTLNLIDIAPRTNPVFTGNPTINAQGQLRLADSDSTHYVGFKSPATVTTSLVWTLPSADATSSGQALTSNSSGVLSWQSVSSTTINNNADNRLITGSGTANTLEGESGLTYDGSTLDVTGAATFSGVVDSDGLTLDDSKYLKIGTHGDLWIYHENSGNTTRLCAHNDRAVDINYYDASLYKSMVTCYPKSSVNLYFNGAHKLGTSNTGITVNGVVAATGVDLGDDGSVQWGVHDDLVISHNGSTNNNRIICYNARTLHVERYDGTDFEDMITAVPDGAVSLFHAGASKLATTSSGITVTGTVTDDKGDVRKIVQNYKTGAYVLVVGDAGKCITITTGGVTVNPSIFSSGDAVSIVNHSGSNQTITQGSSFTLYNTADGTSGNRVLAGRGMCTLFFTDNNIAYISGAGLT